MSISEFISCQAPDRQDLLARLHEIIIQKDKSVTAVVAPMMGKEMIVYNAPGIFKYGLSGMKNYMSLHVMLIYGSHTLYLKYKALLNKAIFQKGCINFKNSEELPPEIIKNLMADCAKIDLRAIKEAYMRSKLKKNK